MTLRFKSAFLLLVSYLAIFTSFSQLEDPVEWSTQTFKTGENEYELVFTSVIDDGWHTYGQNIADGGPLATWFSFVETDGWSKVDSVLECQNALIFEHDPNFDMKLEWFEGTVNWHQKVKVLADSVKSINGFVSYMVCNDEMCLPPVDVDFSFVLADAKEMPSDFEMCPEPTHSHKQSGGGKTHSKDDSHNSSNSSSKQNESNESGSDESENDSEVPTSVWGLFLLGMGLGFAAVFTPCVFPMIPMTVSFFTKQSKTRAQGIRNAFVYGGFIIFIYTGLGLLISAIFGGDALYELSSHPIFNLFLFLVLFIFGLSFLGAFEIQLPSSWANKADSAADKGGLVGIFFMASTLAIVSFSCTGPLVGAALGQSASGGFLGPAAIMFGFSLALAIPFMLFAAFPGWLNALPQSGGWLNSVKVVLGLLEIGFAFKFLSNADLAWQLHLLERELFITIWIAVAACITLYLFGKIKMPHDSPLERLSVTRFMFGLVFLVMTLYLLPGPWGAPLKMIAGFPPPTFYAESEGSFKLKHVEPHFQNDLEAAQEASIKEGKPIVIDYTGWTCVNCRRMEENVWIVPEIAKILEDEVILLSLYTDDRTEIPADRFRTEKLPSGEEVKIKKLGDEWKYKEARDHGTIAQPFYCFEDAEGNLLMKEGIGYDPNPILFLDYLEKGLDAYEANK